MNRTIRWLTVFAFLAAPAQAAACGDAEDPCRIDRGFYHAQVPAGEGLHGAVLFLHGWGGRSASLLRNRALTEALTARGYALLAPQGMPRRPGDQGGAWNSRADPLRRDDIAFLRSVAEDAVARHGVDPARILLAGFSGGGMMTWRVACDAPDAFPAYAPVAGLLWRPLPETCTGPVRMQHTHGFSDPVVPLEGRTVNAGGLTQGDLFRGLAILRSANECDADKPDAFARTGDYQIRRWTTCAPGSALEMALHPGGHAIPKGWAALALDWFEGL